MIDSLANNLPDLKKTLTAAKPAGGNPPAISLEEIRQSFTLLTEYATDAFILHDIQGRIIAANHYACESRGYTREEFVQLSVTDLEQNFDLGSLEKLWKQLKQGVPVSFEGRHRCKNGTCIPVDIRLALIAAGENPLFLAVIRDISERKQAEAILQHESGKLSAIIAALGEGLVLTDSSDHIVEVNPFLTRFLALPASQILGRRIAEMFPEELGSKIGAAIDNFRRDPSGGAVNLAGAIGSRRVELCLQPLQWEEHFYGILLTLAEVTELVRARELAEEAKTEVDYINAQLQQSIEQAHQVTRQAQEANQCKSEYLSTISRQIRSPLNGIIGFAKLLLEAELPQEQRGHVRLILDCGRNLLQLTHDLQDFAHLEKGSLEIQKIPCGVEDILGGIESRIRPRVQAKKIQFEIICARNLPRLNTDPARLRQCLLTLLENALRYTTEGRINLLVRLDQLFGRDHLRFDVSDTGAGIPPEQQDHIFEPFTPARGLQDKQGAGLALAIAARLVQLLGGQVSIESELSQGSTLSLIFPLEIIAAPSECACSS